MTALHNALPATKHDLLIMNIRALMKKSGFNEAELSRRTEIPQATVHKILAEKTVDPRASTLKSLADFFEISIDDLLFGNPAAVKSLVASAQALPVLSWKECINSNELISTLTPTNWKHWKVSEFLSKHAYVLISKPSMAPRFPRDTVLFIDPTVTPKDGDYVIVHYADTDEATIRELSIDGPDKLLLPMNSNVEPTLINKQVKILGVLIKACITY